ncbi:MAG: hydroxymethylbilane synthase [Vicinamibacterales bacterium]|nr:hydroxymethylbilane synthase [Vicinamibacterales bacterium]
MAAEPRILRIGTRGSALALWQADEVSRRLRLARPDLALERVIVRTLGDRALDAKPSELGEVGLFTKEIEQALLRGEIDVAVHSLKDLPTAATEGLVVTALLEREDPRDALVGPPGLTLDTLPHGARIGTSSLRRRSQALARRPDVQVIGLRGNVPTRLEKLAQGEYDALIMAAAGLKRLGLHTHITQLIDPDDLLPAPGQGAVAVQVRADDRTAREISLPLDHLATRLTTAAERTVLARLEAGCHAPVGALATWDGHTMDLRVLVARVDGTHSERRRACADVMTEADARAFGTRVADDLLAHGAAHLLATPPASPDRRRS